MDKIETALTEMLNIKYPVIMAPMFLVSNTAMIIKAAEYGITGAIPALNYRTDKEFRAALEEIKKMAKGPFGINLIANKSNTRLNEQLRSCLDYHVDYIITSLGSPEKIIKECKKQEIRVFCDVVEEGYARKVEALGADAVIAVNSQAGGHAGKLSAAELIPLIRKNCKIPVISAGGVATGQGLLEMLELGACGISMGSPFIASDEAGVSREYKEAIVNYGAKDIVFTTKLSGSPCTIIKTPYVEKIGTSQNWLEALLNKNKRLKKFTKMFTFYKGMKLLEKSAFSASYKTVWCAGPSIEYVKDIRPVGKIIDTMMEEYQEATQKKALKLSGAE